MWVIGGGTLSVGYSGGTLSVGYRGWDIKCGLWGVGH